MNDTKQIDDGGPAFPCSDINDDLTYPRGMSLRDWFAGQAMAGLAHNQEMLLANHQLLKEFGTLGIDKLQAAKAYRLADAMLAARKEKR